MKSKFKNRTVLVTGASKGLGAEFARQLAARGANVVLVARSAHVLRALADELHSKHGVDATFIAADLGASDAPETVMRELDRRGLEIDLLINNAGLGQTGAFLSNPLSHELGSIQVNVHALVALSHLFGRRMRERGHGGIINIASNAAFQPLPHMATYAAAKAFVLHFTEALRHELEASGVHVMAAVPGSTATSFFEGVPVTMQESAFDRADVVVERTLDAFARGKSISYPGRLSIRLATLAPRFFPRKAMVKVAAGATARMGLSR